MNSIKILVNSLNNVYPTKSDYLESLLDFRPSELEEKGEEKQESDENLGLPASNAKSHEHSTPLEPLKQTYFKSKVVNEIGELALILCHAIFFIPNNLLVKPLLFLWLMIAYPFTYFFEKHTSNDDSLIDSSNSMDTPSTTSHDINEKIELLKRENIISNTIKSPTSSSKYIIPPPQRLYPLSRNPGKKRKKILILDLDETLIHSLSRGSPRSYASSSTLHMIEIKLNKISSLYYVHKRPYCDHFLNEVSKHFELQIFTASVREYADPIIDWLEESILDRSNSSGKKVFTKRYYRNDCTYREGVGYIKDLSKFFQREDDLKNVIILDNSPISYALHEDNAVMIEGWINDQRDNDLLSLLPMLHSISLCIDVRFILGLRSGEKIFER